MGKAKSKNWGLGRWSVDSMSMWDKDYIDAEVPGALVRFLVCAWEVVNRWFGGCYRVIHDLAKKDLGERDAPPDTTTNHAAQVME